MTERPSGGAPVATGRQPGLSSREAAERLRRDGPNVLPTARRPSVVLQLVRQLVHAFALLLWVAAALAVLAGMPQLAVAIVAVVVLNGVFAFAQEHRADRAGERLTALLPTRAGVRRDGRRTVVDAAELVVGDRVLLESGDRVCADLVLAETTALGIDESMLTGESVPVRPTPGERAWAGTYVVEGRAEADVVAVGAGTRLASIASETQTAHPPASPLTHELHRLVRTVALIAVGVGTLLFPLALALGMPSDDAFLLSVGVTVALVPEGLLPTVTLSLARAAQRMAAGHALVRRLDAVETLGACTFVCSDKTGTLTRNQMSVVHVWTPAGDAAVTGEGYDPVGAVLGPAEVLAAVRELAVSALHCSQGRAVRAPDGSWAPQGDPMEVALAALAGRAGLDVAAVDRAGTRTHALPFDPRRRRESAVVAGVLHLKGASDSVLERCTGATPAHAASAALYDRGLRVLAVARRVVRPDEPLDDPDRVERDLELLGLVGLEDPPRPGVAEAVAQCRRAGIRLALVTGDHPATGRAIAAEVGLALPGAPVLTGAELPDDDEQLARLLDHDGAVVARVTPEDKLRIARALQQRGHVVAMTGDGVNDGPALREADIGVAMGRSGTDVAREAADLVLLDDAFPTIVTAIELGRATSANLRRFLTYHLTDNVAELTPFLVFALSGGSVPLALTVLMVLALDIGTDLLPALALGAEPPEEGTLDRPAGEAVLVDGALLRRVFGVLGPVEAAVEMAAFCAVLLAGGWAWGKEPSTALLLTASGAAFSAVVLGQLANAFACRSEVLPAWRVPPGTNPLLLWAVAVELCALAAFLLPPLSRALELRPPDLLGWSVALLAVPAVLLVDALHKARRQRRRRRSPDTAAGTFGPGTGARPTVC